MPNYNVFAKIQRQWNWFFHQNIKLLFLFHSEYQSFSLIALFRTYREVFMCSLQVWTKIKNHEKITLKSETEKKSNYFFAFSHVIHLIIAHDQDIESLLIRWLQNLAFIFHSFVVKVHWPLIFCRNGFSYKNDMFTGSLAKCKSGFFHWNMFFVTFSWLCDDFNWWMARYHQ